MNETTIALVMANVRNRFAPDPNTEGAKATRCESCGEEFWQWERQYKKRCSACGAERCVDAIEGSMHKSGPAYEKVVRGQLRHWLAEAERIGLAPGADY